MKKHEAVGYAKFLLHMAEHRERCIAHLAKVLAAGLNLEYKDLEDQAKEDLKHAADFAVSSFNQSGWDLMFDEEGNYVGVVT